MSAFKFSLTDLDSQLVDIALVEDLGVPSCDLTAQLLFSGEDEIGRVVLYSKETVQIVAAGLPLAEIIYQRFCPDIHCQHHVKDGAIVKPGEHLMTILGPSRALATAERTVLNFVRHLSGVATLTRKFVDLVKGTPLKILDTRKTTPGLRHLEKYAVTCGGGMNHRMGLYDAVMIKDTHVDLLGGMEKALEKIPENFKSQVIVEVRNLKELEIVLRHGQHKVNRVLLDNMSIEILQESVALCGGKLETEASGSINLKTIVEIAKTGVDYASVGMLSHSAGQVDLSIRGCPQ